MNRRIVFVVIGAVAVFLMAAALLRVPGPSSLVPARSSERAVYYCPMHPTYTSDRPGDCPICNMRLVKKESESAVGGGGRGAGGKDLCLMHNCPMMHDGKPCPMLVMAKEGEQVECPICGKHVTEAAERPTSTEGLAGYAAVLITPQKQQLIGVKTSPVEKRRLTKTIRTAGRIAYDPELYQAQQEYLQTLKSFQQIEPAGRPELVEQLKRLVESSQMRLRLMGLSPSFIDEMAHWSGPDKRLLAADPSGQVWLYAPVYEFELPSVHIGQTVLVEASAMPGRALEGVITSIDAVLDPVTRSARVRALLSDPTGTLKPEMFVNASIVVDLGDVLAVPEEAVFDTGTKRVVFVDQGQGLFEPREVVLGAKADDAYEVISGLFAGDVVVTSGNFLIDSESRLKAALEGMSGGGHQHGQ